MSLRTCTWVTVVDLCAYLCVTMLAATPIKNMQHNNMISQKFLEQKRHGIICLRQLCYGHTLLIEDAPTVLHKLMQGGGGGGVGDVAGE